MALLPETLAAAAASATSHRFKCRALLFRSSPLSTNTHTHRQHSLLQRPAALSACLPPVEHSGPFSLWRRCRRSSSSRIPLNSHLLSTILFPLLLLNYSSTIGNHLLNMTTTILTQAGINAANNNHKIQKTELLITLHRIWPL